MPHFLFKKHHNISVKFDEIEDAPSSETPFWEIQRAEALDIITTFFSNWQLSWQGTKHALGDLHLTADDLRRLTFYEHEQKQTIVTLLAEILVAWEKDDNAAFSDAVLNLARELRPSLNHFEPSDHGALIFTDFQTAVLKRYLSTEASTLKSAIERLQKLSWHKFDFGDKVLSKANAESLIREKLGLSLYDFLDSTTEPEFNAHGFYPSLLQDAADFGL